MLWEAAALGYLLQWGRGVVACGAGTRARVVGDVRVARRDGDSVLEQARACDGGHEDAPGTVACGAGTMAMCTALLRGGTLNSVHGGASRQRCGDGAGHAGLGLCRGGCAGGSASLARPDGALHTETHVGFFGADLQIAVCVVAGRGGQGCSFSSRQVVAAPNLSTIISLKVVQSGTPLTNSSHWNHAAALPLNLRLAAATLFSAGNPCKVKCCSTAISQFMA
jgi:hypothetical protein